jgi:hypothetical protein
MLFGGADADFTAKMIDSGNYADLIYIVPDNGSIKVDAIRELIDRVRLKPFSADKLMVVIEDSDFMNAQAQNKLLKTLEEPAGNNVIMLLAANIGALRATIRSRCMKISLEAEAADIADSVRKDARDMLSATFFGKPMHEAFAIIDRYADDPFPVLDAMELFLRDVVVGGYEAGLVQDAQIRDIALKLKDRRDIELEAAIAIVEDTRSALRTGRMNRKSGLRDMALRLKVGGIEW